MDGQHEDDHTLNTRRFHEGVSIRIAMAIGDEDLFMFHARVTLI
jgi:hypothetical protein